MQGFPVYNTIVFGIQAIFYFLWDHYANPDYTENRIPLKPALGGVGWGWGGGRGLRMQPRKLHSCI